MSGFLGKLIKGIGGSIPGVGTALELAGAAGKLFGHNKPQQMSQQLTPEQLIRMRVRMNKLQAKANDQTGINYVRKAGGIYDQSMGM